MPSEGTHSCIDCVCMRACLLAVCVSANRHDDPTLAQYRAQSRMTHTVWRTQAKITQLESDKETAVEEVTQEVERLRRLIREALHGDLTSHEAQFKARQLLYFESLKRSARPGFPEASLTWRGQSEEPPLTMPHTLRPSRGRFWEQTSDAEASRGDARYPAAHARGGSRARK